MEKKMKRFALVLMGIFAAVWIFSGCSMVNKSESSSPGKVIEDSSSGSDSQRVVTFSVIGKGLEPENALTKGEAKLLAERAAVADGYRQFVEKIRGVYVDAYMQLGSGMVQQDVIKTKTQSWLRGVEVMEIRQGEYNITEAHMQLRINFKKQGMIWWPSGIPNKPSRGLLPS